MYWLLERNSFIISYCFINQPLSPYRLMVFQNKVLRGVTNAPQYICGDLHKDLEIDCIDNVIKKCEQSHEQRFHQNVNAEVLQLIQTTIAYPTIRIRRTFKFIKSIQKRNQRKLVRNPLYHKVIDKHTTPCWAKHMQCAQTDTLW